MSISLSFLFIKLFFNAKSSIASVFILNLEKFSGMSILENFFFIDEYVTPSLLLGSYLNSSLFIFL